MTNGIIDTLHRRTKRWLNGVVAAHMLRGQEHSTRGKLKRKYPPLPRHVRESGQENNYCTPAHRRETNKAPPQKWACTDVQNKKKVSWLYLVRLATSPAPAPPSWHVPVNLSSALNQKHSHSREPPSYMQPLPPRLPCPNGLSSTT